MNSIESELIARLIVRECFAAPKQDAGYSMAMQRCMLLERVAGEYMDELGPKERAIVGEFYSSIIPKVLSRCRTRRN